MLKMYISKKDSIKLCQKLCKTTKINLPDPYSCEYKIIWQRATKKGKLTTWHDNLIICTESELQLEVCSEIPLDYYQVQYMFNHAEYMRLDTVKTIEEARLDLTEEEFDKCKTEVEVILMAENKDLHDQVDQLSVAYLEQEGVITSV